MKIDHEELLELLSIWPLTEVQHDSIKRIIEEVPVSDGAWLCRYYGPRPSKVSQLEQDFAQACGASQAVAVNSGTSALIAALVASGIGPGDDVLIPAYTFIATASAVLIAGAVPNFVEVDDTLTLDPDDLERKVTANTRAIIPVHMRGVSSNMEAILRVAADRQLQVIEDVAQACGGQYRGKWLGTFGHAGCFSFGQYKTLNTGEGGMVVTSDDDLAMRVRSYHDTAAFWRPNRYARERVPGELFPGEDYRMSELHGAIGLAQLRKLPRYLAACRAYRATFVERLNRSRMFPVQIAPNNDEAGDIAQWIIFLTPSPDFASTFTQLLLAEGIKAGGRYDQAKRDWHVYCFWEHILNRQTANRSGHPYSSYPLKALNYSHNACPRTLDILGRAAIISIPALIDFGTEALAAAAVTSAIQRTISS